MWFFRFFSLFRFLASLGFTRVLCVKSNVSWHHMNKTIKWICDKPRAFFTCGVLRASVRLRQMHHVVHRQSNHQHEIQRFQYLKTGTGYCFRRLRFFEFDDISRHCAPFLRAKKVFVWFCEVSDWWWTWNQKQMNNRIYTHPNLPAGHGYESQHGGGDADERQCGVQSSDNVHRRDDEDRQRDAQPDDDAQQSCLHQPLQFVQTKIWFRISGCL